MARNPRILIVTPEITYLPQGMGNMSNQMRAKAGGLADVSASLVSALFKLGADVHVALPHYRRLFHVDVGRLIKDELRTYKRVLPDDRIHLAQDRVFYYQAEVYSRSEEESRHIALAFQREVINNIVPKVNPDLIHCNDWMTGLVPAMARRMGIPSLLTLHNIHTQDIPMGEIEYHGIDAAEFWQNLYFKFPPPSYECARECCPVDLLTSGVFAAHYVNTVSPTFLNEICNGQHDMVPPALRTEIINKKLADCAVGILNAPDAAFNPAADPYLERRFTAEDALEGKRENKLHLQERLGLLPDADAPLFFWPSRLDPVQKGCQLLAEILYGMVSNWWDRRLQVVFVANGPYQQVFHQIVRHHDFYERVAVCDFDEELSHQAYAASDFILMPSLFEPCGLPQMVSQLYGSLPVVNDTGGLHDTVDHLDTARDTGNGFAFRVYNSTGLWWAVEEAMRFHALPAPERARHVARIMHTAATTFTHANTASRYIHLYERMLERPLIARSPGSAPRTVS